MITDFDETVLAQNGFPATFTATGVQQSNNLLTNPITDAGTFCRDLQGHVTSLGFGQQIFTIKSSVHSGNFVSVPAGTKITVKGWLRNALGIEAVNIGLLAKMPVVGGGHPGESFEGYKLRLGNLTEVNATGAFALRLTAHRADGSDGSAAQVVCSGSYAANTWYRVRFDIEVVAGNDRLTAFVGSGATGSETWAQVGTLTIQPTDSNFIAWGRSDTRIGFYSAVSQNGSSSTSHCYIDAFEADVVST